MTNCSELIWFREKKDQIPFNAFWKGAGKGEEGLQAMKMKGDKKLRGQSWALV